jgi:hypothetical protein
MASIINWISGLFPLSRRPFVLVVFPPRLTSNVQKSGIIDDSMLFAISVLGRSIWLIRKEWLCATICKSVHSARVSGNAHFGLA